jgi:tetratricopeptide (TPR) repeat protein
LIHLVHGDLDWIVMKCLEKDRTRRYETANGLALDLKRHLSNEPVTARPPSRAYQFQKLVRRNKLAFAAAAAVAAALIIGAFVSTLQAVRAVRAEREQSRLRNQAEANRKKAETEAIKATAISDFLQELLSSANPYELKGSEYTVRQLLDDFSAGLGTRLAGQPEVEATVRNTIGHSYHQLGLAEKAEPHFERVLALRRRIFGEQSQEVAQSLVNRAWNLGEQARWAEAEAEIHRALDIYGRIGADAQPLIHARYALGVILNAQKRFKESETMSEEALALARNSPNRDFPDMANLLHNLAQSKVGQAEYVEGETLALQAAELHRRLRGPEHPETAWSLMILGRALAGQHRLAEAQPAYLEALAIFHRYHSFEHKNVQSAVLELKAVLEAKGEPAAVEALYREGLAAQRTALGNDSPAVAETLSNLAAILYAQGKQVEAEKASREAMEIILKLRNQDLAKLPPILRRLAEALKSQGKSQDAEKLYEGVIPVVRLTLGESHSALGELLFDFGTFLAYEGRIEAAVEYHLQSLPIRRAQPDDNLAWTLRNLGGELVTIGRPQEAESYLRGSVALYRKLHPQEDLYGTAWPMEKLGEALDRQHKLPQAEQVYRDAVAAYEKAAPDDWRTFNARSMLGGVLVEQKKYADAEPLLLSGYEGLKQREDKIPTGSKARLQESLQRLVQLYQATDQSEKTAEWTKKLVTFDQAEAAKKTADPKP